MAIGNLDINKTVGSWGVHEQWVYGSSMEGGGYMPSHYLYFEDGILTTYQT